MACFNRKEQTLECLNQLFKQYNLGIDFQIKVYLLDDLSTDGTAELIRQEFPQVKIIKGNGSLFWNRGMHTAWTVAAKDSFYDYFLWLNNDTMLYEDALKKLINAAEITFSKAIICGCVESEIERGVLTYGGGTYMKRRYVSNYPDGKLTKCEVINGNCVLVPNSVFEKIGNLDWTFIHAIGDNDYSLRAKQAKIQTFTTESFIATCERNTSLPKWCLPDTKLSDRVSSLYSPLGNSQPILYFKYTIRHFGVISAIRSFALIHLRVLFPSLWRIESYKK